jgi:endonuclease-3
LPTPWNAHWLDNGSTLSLPSTIEPILKKLRSFYGAQRPASTDPYRMILLENIAYLSPDAVREALLAELEERIGLEPVRILAEKPAKLAKLIAPGGMQPMRRAEKLRTIAEVSVQFADGDLTTSLARMTATEQRRLLKRFPGIGDPGADKIMLFCGMSIGAALDSNGLRVLERYGFIDVTSSYATSYKAGTAFLDAALPRARKARVEAFLLLQTHGRQLCKRSAPRCDSCPLARGCGFLSR